MHIQSLGRVSDAFVAVVKSSSLYHEDYYGNKRHWTAYSNRRVVITKQQVFYDVSSSYERFDLLRAPSM